MSHYLLADELKAVFAKFQEKRWFRLDEIAADFPNCSFTTILRRIKRLMVMDLLVSGWDSRGKGRPAKIYCKKEYLEELLSNEL